jgi:hypothetical protein
MFYVCLPSWSAHCLVETIVMLQVPCFANLKEEP